MDSSQSIPDLIAAAQVSAKTSEDQIAQIEAEMDGQAASDAQGRDLAAAVVALELAAVDAFTLFEARMQHHFKRGPFSRKLKAKLLDAGQADLAGRIHYFYLAINVLKHGTGASYRELIDKPTTLFNVKPVKRQQSDDADAGERPKATGIIDVGAPGFFDALASTLLEAHQFLEKR